MLRASRDAIPALAALCGCAFLDNPLFVAVLPDAAARARALPALFRVSLSLGVEAGQVLCSSAQLDDVSVWLDGGRLRPGPWLALRAGGVALVSTISPRVLEALRRTDDVHAAHRRWAPAAHRYLSLIAVAPAVRSRGRAGALLARGLAGSDARGLPTYLETAVPGLEARFARDGFVVVERLRVGPRGVPHVAMLRPPAAVGPART